MLVNPDRLASLPTNTPAYQSMKATADHAMTTLDLTEPASGASPWLPNYAPNANGIGKGAQTLAAALVYARTGDQAYKDFVVRVNRFIIGSETEDPNNGETDDRDKSLAVMRQISAYILAADLVGMDRRVTGSRAGEQSKEWVTWLGELRTTRLDPSPANKLTIEKNLEMATNHSAWALASLTAINVYLGDEARLAYVIGRVKLYLGETMEGTPWVKSLEYNGSWACHPPGVAVEFIPVNPADCGPGFDGIMVEDASRSDDPNAPNNWPNWSTRGKDYSFHGYMAVLVTAIMLDQHGHHDVWNWGNQAIKRIMDQFNRLGIATGNGRSQAQHVSWIPRYFYGVDYPKVTRPLPADTLGYTDWLYPELGGSRR
jgi:hypothetical protein